VREYGAAGQGLLAIGDPDYDRTENVAAKLAVQLAAMLTTFRGARPGCASFEQLRFERLPSTRKEIREIDRAWKRAQKQESTIELTGQRASEARVKAEISGKRLVHFATHGFFLEDECRGGNPGPVALREPRAIPSETPPAGTPIENPLLLSGLALAGSNARDDVSPEQEDGILTAEELATLDLSGIEWAVLSACDTGTGDVRASEGVFGLRRAFETAGAHTVIMSLWSIEDEAGRAWMNELYRARYIEGRSTADALTGASRRILSERRAQKLTTHPSGWAGFIAAGDWR
jgi:CHAT domain-containing protein